MFHPPRTPRFSCNFRHYRISPNRGTVGALPAVERTRSTTHLFSTCLERANDETAAYVCCAGHRRDRDLVHEPNRQQRAGGIAPEHHPLRRLLGLEQGRQSRQQGAVRRARRGGLRPLSRDRGLLQLDEDAHRIRNRRFALHVHESEPEARRPGSRVRRGPHPESHSVDRLQSVPARRVARREALARARGRCALPGDARSTRMVTEFRTGSISAPARPRGPRWTRVDVRWIPTVTASRTIWTSVRTRRRAPRWTPRDARWTRTATAFRTASMRARARRPTRRSTPRDAPWIPTATA